MQDTHQKELVAISHEVLKPFGFKKKNSKWSLIKDEFEYTFDISKSWGDQYNISVLIQMIVNGDKIWVIDLPIQRYINDLTNTYFVNFHPPYNRVENYKEELQKALSNFCNDVLKINSFADLKNHLLGGLNTPSTAFSAKARPLFFD